MPGSCRRGCFLRLRNPCKRYLKVWSQELSKRTKGTMSGAGLGENGGAGVRCQDDVKHTSCQGGDAAASAARVPWNVRPPGAAQAAAERRRGVESVQELSTYSECACVVDMHMCTCS